METANGQLQQVASVLRNGIGIGRRFDGFDSASFGDRMNSSSPFDAWDWKREALEYLVFLLAMVLAAAALMAQ